MYSPEAKTGETMTKRLGIAEALREAIAEEMERDPRVFCIGRRYRRAGRVGRRVHRDPGPGEDDSPIA